MSRRFRRSLIELERGRLEGNVSFWLTIRL